MPSMLISVIQGVVSSVPLNAAGAVLVGLFALARTRGDWGLAWFSVVVYFLVSAYLIFVSGAGVATGARQEVCLGVGLGVCRGAGPRQAAGPRPLRCCASSSSVQARPVPHACLPALTPLPCPLPFKTPPGHVPVLLHL
jgi:hypothetical protein